MDTCFKKGAQREQEEAAQNNENLIESRRGGPVVHRQADVNRVSDTEMSIVELKS